MKKEKWVDIIGLEGFYKISSFGRCKSLERLVKGKKGSIRKINGKILNPVLSKGYWRYCISINSKTKHYYAHILAAKHFIPNPENKPEVNHKDFDKGNNCITNLEWNTRVENNNHMIAGGRRKIIRGTDAPKNILSEKEVLRIASSKETIKNLAARYNVSENTIYSVQTGDNWGWLTGIKYKKKNRYVSEKTVLAIFNSKESGVKLAKKYSLTTFCVSSIKTGKAWSSITGKKYTKKLKQ